MEGLILLHGGNGMSPDGMADGPDILPRSCPHPPPRTLGLLRPGGRPFSA